MITLYEAIQPSQLIPQVNGQVTVSIVNPSGITTTMPDGSKPPTRPAIVGDVYSIQPNGTVEGRVVGTNGTFELAKQIGAAVVWAPLGTSGAAYEAPYVSGIPNG
jgi:hypothetical protein